nr:uncharacterized protein LOC26531757 [Drosophila virilis]
MNILKLKKCCCCCVDLRCGCVIIYAIEFFFAVCGLCLGEWSENNHFWIVLRIGYMAHLIGTVFLLMGIILKSPSFLMVYLVTNGIHVFTSTTYLILWALRCVRCIYVVTLSTFGILCSIYFWLIVYSLRLRCKWEQSIDYDGSVF